VAQEEVAGVGTAAPKLGVGAAILQGEEERGGWWTDTRRGRRWHWDGRTLSPVVDDSGGLRGSDRRRGGGSAGVRKWRRTATTAPCPLPTPPSWSPWLSSHRCLSPASPTILVRAPAPRAPPLRFPSGLEPPLPLMSCTHGSHRQWQRKWRMRARGRGDAGSTVWWLRRCGVGLKQRRRSGSRTGGCGGDGSVVELGDGGA
jgi:hypothetical protein